MQRVRLGQLLQGVRLEFISDRKALERLSVSSLSTDTRSLKRGDLFIAIPGEQYDGHAFIGDSLARGASGVLFNDTQRANLSQLMDESPSTPFIGVSDTRKTLGSMAVNYSRIFSVTKLALTGSAGKTTTKGLIHAVLSQKYRVVASIQSYNNDIGVPKTLFTIDRTTQVLVQEMGTNHPGEIEYLASLVQPDCALVTNIGPAHVGYFGSVRNIAREKREIFRALGSEGTAFLNCEDPYYRFLKRGVQASCKCFGLRGGDLFPDRVVSCGVDYTEFVLGGVTMRARVLGTHGVLNATAAALVGKHFGLSMEEVKRGIEEYEGESGRGAVHRRANVTIVDESYNANPLSVSASLDYLGGVETAGRKFFVFADMLELGRSSNHYHRVVARDVLRNGVDIVYTFGEKALVTAARCKAAGHRNVVHFNDIELLGAKLGEEVSGGDIVLVKGSRAMRLERAIEALV
jgi:UDP-N-acetylmuramoyl-tripeptide--D-alanyl-D-alanine ligase